MTLDQAKFILQGYRVDQDTRELPELEEALRMLDHNKELQTWFEQEQAFDEAFAKKLSEIEIPAQLESRILGQVVENSDKVVEFPWWRQISILGAVASMLLILGLVILPSNESRLPGGTSMSVESFQDFAAQSLKSPNGFSARAADWSSLAQYLNDQNAPSPEGLPGKINEMPPAGCMTLTFNDKPVGVICFGKNRKSHLFVINSEDFPTLPKEDRPVLKENPYATTAYWTKNDRHYLLLSHDPQELKQFVSF